MSKLMDVQQLFSVKDKVVVVTGGGSGVGEMIAEAFVSGGAKVYIASRKAPVVEKTAARLTKAGPGVCIPFSLSLSTQENCKKLAALVAEKETKVDVLVNNAGSNWGAPIEQYPDIAWDKVLALNVKSVFHLTVAMLPLLRAAASVDNAASVINIGSVDGIRLPTLETYAYSASKAALHQLSRHLAGRLAKDYITVNTLACGPFRSHMMEATLAKFEKLIVADTALKRVGSPQDVGGACIYLASAAGNWITGVTLPVDGGSLLASKL